jgi:hypothetical protein
MHVEEDSDPLFPPILYARLIPPPQPLRSVSTCEREKYYSSLREHHVAAEVQRSNETFNMKAVDLSNELYLSMGLSGQQTSPALPRRLANWRWRRNALHASWEAREVAWLGWNTLRRANDRLLQALVFAALRINMAWRALKFERRRTGAAAAHTAACFALVHAPRHRRKRAMAATAVTGRWHLSLWASVAQRHSICSRCFRRLRQRLRTSRCAGALWQVFFKSPLASD